MAVDYYKLLQVDRNAQGEDLKKAADARIKQIREAYEVLSDPRKRAAYDENTADHVFSRFFGSGTGGYRVYESRAPEDIFSQFQSFGFTEGGGNRRRKAAPIEKTLACSLEELFNGTTKKLKISRDIVGASGNRSTVEEVITIEVKRGWKKGTKITFPEKGNDVDRGVIPADVIFVIDETPHGLFKRDGNDLIVTRKIPLAEALTGSTQLTTVDGRDLKVCIDTIANLTHEEVVKGEGMPIKNEPFTKGNLIVKFDIKFPKLTSDQKTGIRRLLASP